VSSSKPGPATIYAVAESAGVSIATVSRVLQGTNRVAEPTRQRVLDAARDLDYLPRGSARALAAKKHEAVGLMVPELTGPYFAELLVGFETAAAELGLSVALVMTNEPGLSRPLRQLAARVDGLAVMSGREQLASAEMASLARRMPIVSVASGQPDGIGTENEGSAAALTTHLFGHGRRRLRFVGDPDLAADAAQRYAGFTAAHAEAGLHAAPPIRVRFSEEAGREVARGLVTSHALPDGLVCVNDEVAFALLDELQRAGLDVPGDLAVTGWDDGMTARYTRPGLTSVAQPVRDLGRLAVTTLAALIAGTGTAEPTTLPTRIVFRGSCGCPEPLAPVRARENTKEEPE